ncbi:MAG: ATP-binding protein [Ignavibacteriota bacterium]
MGSTFESAAAADALREEIGRMAEDGRLTPLMERWGFLPGRTGELIEAERGARQRERLFLGIAVVFAILLLLAVSQAYRATQESKKVKRSELELRESERRFRGLLEDVPMSAVIVDLLGRFTFCNDHFLSATGWERQELLGRTIAEFLVPEDRLWMSRLVESFSDSTPSHWTSPRAARFAGFRPNFVVLRDAQSKRVGFAVLSVDITEHRVLQAQYLQAQKMEGLGRLAGGVAHDFNNLLTVINGYSDLVYRNLKHEDALRSRVEQIMKAGARAADLTQQLLAFSRKQMIQPKPLCLNLIVEDSREMWKHLLGEAIQLETKLSPALGQVMADAGLLHQVLMNLVVNAPRLLCRMAGSSPSKRPNVDVDPSWLAEDSEAIAGPYVALAVSDTGVGMDEDTRKRIFEPFFTTKPTGQGTGLGLSTVYGIVKQSRGWVRVYSEPGAGTMFRIYLPRIQAATGGRAVEIPGKVSSQHAETVLLVEDQEEVRQYANSRFAGRRVPRSERGRRKRGACSARELRRSHRRFGDGRGVTWDEWIRTGEANRSDSAGNSACSSLRAIPAESRACGTSGIATWRIWPSPTRLTCL